MKLVATFVQEETWLTAADEGEELEIPSQTGGFGAGSVSKGIIFTNPADEDLARQALIAWFAGQDVSADELTFELTTE